MVRLDISTYPKVATPIAIIGGSIVFLLAVAALANAALQAEVLPTALKKGAVIAHLATVLLALPLGVSQLVLPKGTVRHRAVGYLWCALMTATALISFAVHQINPGGFSPIHLFSIMTLVMVPVIIFNARAGRVAAHQRSVLGLMIGALVIAGLFTFLPSRALGGLVFKLFSAA
jgi:uncharacterized membrane protein